MFPPIKEGKNAVFQVQQSVWVGEAKGNASFQTQAFLSINWQGIFKQRRADGKQKHTISFQ